MSRAFSLTGFQCSAAPAGTPKAVLTRLSELLVAAGKSEKVQAMMAQLYDTEAPIWLDLVKGLALTPE